jgi:site-specific recombinase XerD
MKDILTLLKEYEENLGKYRSVETVCSQHHELMKFFTWLSLSGRQLDVKSIGRQEIESYLAEYSSLEITAGTYRKSLGAIRGFLEYLRENEIIRENPAKRIAMERSRGLRPLGVYSETEIERILGVLPASGFGALRERSIITMLYSTSLWRNELVGLNICDADTARHRLTVRDDRSSRERIVAVGDMAYGPLVSYLKERMKIDIPTDALYICQGNRRITRSAIFNRMQYWRKKAQVDARGLVTSFRHECTRRLVEHRACTEAAGKLAGGEKRLAAACDAHREGKLWNG